MKGAEVKKINNNHYKVQVNRGLDIPLVGDPGYYISAPFQEVKEVALLGADYVGMKPTMLVKEGDRVKKGQPLFTDKKNEQIVYTSIASGTIKAIHRGDKRVFESVVIGLDGNDEEKFEQYSAAQLASLTQDQAKNYLLKTGLWTSLIERPFGKVANPNIQPSSIFITAIDTNPNAPNPAKIIEKETQAFVMGVNFIARLSGEAKVVLCVAQGYSVPENESLDKKIILAEIAGPHPSGNAGTHIHLLDPIKENKFVWQIGYQDVIAIGKTAINGSLYVDRVIAVCGPAVLGPTLVKTRRGADVNAIVASRTNPGENRIISGSVLSGRRASGSEAYLGHFHNQISVLREGRERVFMGWQAPGFDKFSIRNIFAAKLMFTKKFAMTTSTEGSHRAMVPIGNYEKVMPLDILPTHLLRALAVKDTDTAQELGALELLEEDLALCSFVCPGKNNYEVMLRENLTIIEKEG